MALLKGGKTAIAWLYVHAKQPQLATQTCLANANFCVHLTQLGPMRGVSDLIGGLYPSPSISLGEA